MVTKPRQSASRTPLDKGQVAEWFRAPVLKPYCGRVAEWSIAAVLKTADVQASVGSNPTPSAMTDRNHLGECMFAVVAGVALLATAATADSHDLRRFTLVCTSAKTPRPPIPTWVVDVNLDLLTYYVESWSGGPNEIASDDGNRITFRRWRRDMHGVPMATQEAFDRSDGHWYFSVRSDGALMVPDAICTQSLPREGFRADVKYTLPSP